VWNIGDVRDIDTRRRLTDEEVQQYLAIVVPEQDWQQAKEELWRDCSQFGKPGTKEKEKNIQIAILEQGVEV
jgi:hypothetical protein